MRTVVCDMLDIEFPIIAFSHCRDVVAAVSRAGGLGMLGATVHTPDELEIDLAWLDVELGGRPYGVDVLLPAGPGGKPIEQIRQEIPHEHRSFLNGLLAHYEIPELPADEADDGTIAAGLSVEGGSRLLDIALAHRIRIVASALGTPPAAMVEQAHAQDILVAGLSGKAEHAVRQKQAGADIVVAQGYEAGGHTGEIATMVLVPEVVDAVGPTPVLAAGGIASGRQIAAAMALGAQGVWTGSVWLGTSDAETHPVVKEKFFTASSSDTVRSRCGTGKPARQLRSAWTQAWEGPTAPAPLGMPHQTLLIADAERRIRRAAAVGSPGGRALINHYVGQVVGRMTTERPARQVFFDMVEEYIDAVTGLATTLDVEE